jgi:hypothetical protein
MSMLSAIYLIKFYKVSFYLKSYMQHSISMTKKDRASCSEPRERENSQRAMGAHRQDAPVRPWRRHLPVHVLALARRMSIWEKKGLPSFPRPSLSSFSLKSTPSSRILTSWQSLAMRIRGRRRLGVRFKPSRTASASRTSASKNT